MKVTILNLDNSLYVAILIFRLSSASASPLADDVQLVKKTKQSVNRANLVIICKS